MSDDHQKQTHERPIEIHMSAKVSVETDTERNTRYVNELVQDKCDPVLGKLVRQRLIGLGLVRDSSGDEQRAMGPIYAPKSAHAALMQGIYSAFKNLGLDVDNDPSIKDTPRRYATMFVGELSKGLNYDFFPKCTAQPNGTKQLDQEKWEKWLDEREAGWEYKKTRQEIADMPSNQSRKQMYTSTVGAYNQMVLVKQIQTVSLCEHHLQTIDGYTHIAYIPGSKVLGLSKFARVVEFFAAQPQIQERFTEQVYEALRFILETDDVAVVCTAKHFCMHARGAKQHQSLTTTDKVGGRFMTNLALRKEFLDAI